MSAEPVDRRSYSLERLGAIGDELKPLDPLLAGRPLCIYATGSYGRLEAWEKSDIDLFFLYEPEHEDDEFPWITFVRLTARLIEITEAMGFPSFSGDGRYLEVHDIDRMERVLGSPEDDSLNAFTARMLLLLESKPVYGSERYSQILRRVVGFYYRDFAGHEHDFVPVFLTNDILRFWRTLTLNYEHDRYKISRLEGDQREQAKAMSALKNYKLKCSRLLTCYSMVVHLSSATPPVTEDAVLELCVQTPRERLTSLAGRSNDADQLLADIADRYSLFLKTVQQPDDQLLTEFGSTGLRAERLAEAARLGELMFDLLFALVDRDRLRHLVV